MYKKRLILEFSVRARGTTLSHGAALTGALQLIMVTLILTDSAQGAIFGRIESFPRTLYVHEGDQRIILRCQNWSANHDVFYNNVNDAQWYRLFPNGTTHQFGAGGPVYVQNHGLYFHSSIRPEDQGIYYCCKPNGSCSGNSTVAIAVPPAIEAVKREYIRSIGSNVTLTCHITNPGIPVASFGWRRRGVWLSNDLMSINSTHFSLTLTNLTDVDGGHYRCAAQGKLSLSIQNVNLIIKVYPEVTIRGPTEENFGSNVSINCTLLKGNPLPSVSIITPRGDVIEKPVISFNATMRDAGNYACVANNSVGTATRNLSLTVYVAPQPVNSRKWIQTTYGADVVLPCIVDMAYPPPLYHWEHMAPHDNVVVGRSQLLSNGSLLLTSVKSPAIYKCVAWNEYGISTQLIYITVDNKKFTNTTMMFFITDPKGNCHHNRSEIFKEDISAAFEEYIRDICNCTLTLANANLICINATSALYTVQLMDENSLYSIFTYELLNLIITENEIDLGVAIVHHTWIITQTNTSDDDSDENISDWIYPLIYSLLGVLFVVLLFSIYFNYRRCITRSKHEKHHEQGLQESDNKSSIESPTGSAVLLGCEGADDSTPRK